jgi:energy-coupling factor transporter ATP-binding protein EcfA2
MLEQLHLQNFRGFRDHIIPIRRTTLAVGRNNAGKSSVVEALRLISIVTTRFRALGYRDAPDWGGIPKRECGVRPSLKGLEINFSTMFHQYAAPPAVIEATFSGGARVKVYVGGEDRVHAVVFDDRGTPVRSKSAALRVDLPPVEILPQIGPLEVTDVVLSEEYIRRTESSGLFSKHFRNQLRVYKTRVKTFKEMVEQTWPAVQVRELRCPRPVQGEPLSLIIRDGDFVAEAASMGHGLQMWLQTLWFIARVGAGACVVLDEPDVYMHPDLQRRLLRYLRRRHEQIIIATHSVEMMSEVEPEEILVVDRHQNSSSFAADAVTVQRLLEHLGSAHNLQLARLGNARKCILVEGKDIKLLSAVHQILFPEADSLETVPNMGLGGWGGWQYAVGSSMFLKNSGGDEIIVYCIFDRDYHSSEALAKRRNEAPTRRVRLHIWARKEIENYFLLPRPILRAIRRRMPARAVAPTEAEISAQLEVICEGLRDEVFDAIAAELLAENRALGAGGANKAARQVVAQQWQTLDAKLRIVSGKRVFGALSCWAEAQLGASLSAAIVARDLARQDIDEEMRMVLTAIQENQDFEVPLAASLGTGEQGGGATPQSAGPN